MSEKPIEEEYEKSMSDTKIKTFQNTAGKKLQIAEDSIVLDAGEALKIELTGAGMSFISGTNITLNSKTINITAPNVTFIGEEKILIESNQASMYLDKDVVKLKGDKVCFEVGSSKPYQVHHYLTNKSKTYTEQIEAITKKYGLELDEDWNKELLPHQGRHPNAYHEYVLEKIDEFDAIAQGDSDVFLQLFEGLKKEIRENPAMLYKDYWLNK